MKKNFKLENQESLQDYLNIRYNYMSKVIESCENVKHIDSVINMYGFLIDSKSYPNFDMYLPENKIKLLYFGSQLNNLITIKANKLIHECEINLLILKHKQEIEKEKLRSIKKQEALYEKFLKIINNDK